MAVKIRLQRRGRKKAPYYHIVVADTRSPRDGKYIERIGMYNPISKPASIELDRDSAFSWLMKGAQPTDTVLAILRYKGIMYRKHLQLGVTKGALTQEVADAKYLDWINKKEGTIQEAVNKSKKETSDFHSQMITLTKAKKIKEVAPTEVPSEDAAEAMNSNEAATDSAIEKTNDVEA